MTPREQVAGHAANLDRIAKEMEASGIGGHPTAGHSAILKRMASAMRADAAGGKVPYEYNDRASMYAAAIQPLPGQVIRTLSAASLPTDRAITVAEFDTAAARAGVDVLDRLIAKRSLEKAGRLV